MRIVKAAIVGAAILVAAGSPAWAESKTLESCVPFAEVEFRADHTAMYSVWITAADGWMTLHKEGFRLDGVADYLTPEDLHANALALDLVQSAGLNKRRLTISFDPATKYINRMTINWAVNC